MRRTGVALGALPLILGACASVTATRTPEPTVASAPSIEPTRSAQPTPRSSSEPQAVVPGLLTPAVRYEVHSLGLSFEADAEWFAVLQAGGDLVLSREAVQVHFVRPLTVRQPDGRQAAAPPDVEELVAAMEATEEVRVTATEPFDANGLTGLQVDLDVNAGGDWVHLVQVAGGEFGLVSGQFRWIVLSTDAGPIVISIERPDDPDIAETWEVAEPLLASLRPLSPGQ